MLWGLEWCLVNLWYQLFKPILQFQGYNCIYIYTVSRIYQSGFWRHLLLLGRHLLAVIAERSWIISSDEVHCPRVYETVNVSQFTGFVIWNSTIYDITNSIITCIYSLWIRKYFFQIVIVFEQYLSDIESILYISETTNHVIVIPRGNLRTKVGCKHMMQKATFISAAYCRP